ncbi:MAG: hypothetical protein JSS66_05570 [Armatimonadetes bacterium]|nr:hypothetical protein [Armatimonadota bacterium]
MSVFDPPSRPPEVESFTKSFEAVDRLGLFRVWHTPELHNQPGAHNIACSRSPHELAEQVWSDAMTGMVQHWVEQESKDLKWDLFSTNTTLVCPMWIKRVKWRYTQAAQVYADIPIEHGWLVRHTDYKFFGSIFILRASDMCVDWLLKPNIDKAARVCLSEAAERQPTGGMDEQLKIWYP